MATRLAVPTAPTPARRRKRAECEQRIVEAARTIFAEQGYDRATTREIAQHAEVSETLLFRYFGSKAALFDRIIFAPVGGLLSDFLTTHSTRQIDDDPLSSTREFLHALLVFIDANRKLLTTYAARTMTSDGSEPGLTGLTDFYDLAGSLIIRMHEARGSHPDVAPSTAVRLSLGMVIASTLFERWLFPTGPLDRDELVDSLSKMLVSGTIGAINGEPLSGA